MDRHGQMAKQGLLDKRGLTSDTQNNPEPVPDPRTGSGLFEHVCGIVGMSVHCAVFRHLPMFRHFTCTLSDIRVPLQLCKLWVRSFFVGTTIVHPWVEKVWTLDNLSYPMEPATLSTLCPQMMDRFGIILSALQTDLVSQEITPGNALYSPPTARAGRRGIQFKLCLHHQRYGDVAV